MKFEWITTILSLIIAIIAIIISIQTKNEWKAEKRYDEFKSYYEKLNAQKTAAFEIIGVINVYKNPVDITRSKEENFIWFRNELAPKCINFAEKMKVANDDLFLAFMDENTIKAERVKEDIEKKLISLFDLQYWKNVNDAKISEIEKEIQKFVEAVDKVIFEAGKSLKNKKTIKF